MDHATDAVVSASVAAATSAVYMRAGINLQAALMEARGDRDRIAAAAARHKEAHEASNQALRRATDALAREKDYGARLESEGFGELKAARAKTEQLEQHVRRGIAARALAAPSQFVMKTSMQTVRHVLGNKPTELTKHINELEYLPFRTIALSSPRTPVASPCLPLADLHRPLAGT